MTCQHRQNQGFGGSGGCEGARGVYFGFPGISLFNHQQPAHRQNDAVARSARRGHEDVSAGLCRRGCLARRFSCLTFRVTPLPPGQKQAILEGEPSTPGKPLAAINGRRLSRAGLALRDRRGSTRACRSSWSSRRYDPAAPGPCGCRSPIRGDGSRRSGGRCGNSRAS
jgi:hypothetical protein